MLNIKSFRKYWPNYWLEIFGLIALFTLILGHHFWAIQHVPPIHDASNCIARAANLGINFYRGHFGDGFAALWSEKNNFLSLGYFGFFNFLLGPGRVAWGFAWVCAIVIFLFALNIINRSQKIKTNYVLLFLLIFFCSPLMSRQGGLLDQRFDPISVLILMLAATFIYRGKFLGAAWLTALAIYAKGPALPVAGLMWITALLTGTVPFKPLIKNIKSHVWKWAGVVIAAVIYKIYFLQVVLSYNLMQVSNASAPKNLILGFIKTFFGNVLADPFAYLRFLKASYPIAALILLAAVLHLVLSHLKNKDKTRKLFLSSLKASWGLLFFFAIYLLFSSHPVKSDVLLIWFVPALWIITLSLAEAILQISRKKFRNRWILVCVVATAFAGSISFYKSYLAPNLRILPDREVYWDGLKADSQDVATVLSQAKPQRVRLLVNFLWWPQHPLMAFNYDSFRVLIGERMGRNTPILEGWELATWSGEWLKEINTLPSNEMRLILLSDGGDNSVHHRQMAKLIANQVKASVNPKCQHPMTFNPERPMLGKMRMYLTDFTLKNCPL